MLEKPTDLPAVEATDSTASGGWDMQERRAFPRAGLELPVRLTVVPSASGGEQFVGNLNGTTRDMSRGGCAIITDTEIAERTRCIARFPLATGRVDPDTVWAEIRRVRRVRNGVLLGLEFETPLATLLLAPASGEASEEAASGPHTILVVDDQPGVNGLLSQYLVTRGFVVRTAADGEQAFGMLLADPPDVLLLDLYLPRLNGHDLLRRMRDAGLKVGLIFTMSGYADTADAQECLRLGAADHLLKPIDLEHLYRSILLRLGTHSA